MTKKISVIIPLYNKEHYITQCLDSILEQSYTNWEAIIVDDGSTDNSKERVMAFLEDSRLKYFYKKNGGVSSARNYGFEKSTGDYIIYIDADDTFESGAFEQLISLAEKYRVPVVTGNLYVQKGNNKTLFCLLNKESLIRNNFKDYMLGKICLRAGAVMFRRDIVYTPFYREDLSRNEDFETVCNIMRSYEIAYTPNAIMSYNNDSLGLSKKSDIQKDFLGHISFEKKPYWEKVSLGYLIFVSVSSYGWKKLFRLYYGHLFYVISAIFLYAFQKLKRNAFIFRRVGQC